MRRRIPAVVRLAGPVVEIDRLAVDVEPADLAIGQSALPADLSAS